jgi:alpha-L-fucosidase 2
LPGAWADGEVRGWRARGGVEVDMKWVGGKLVTARLVSRLGGAYRVRVGRGSTLREVVLGKGEGVTLAP